MATRPLPPHLEPYLALPPELSQVLLTGTLACSTTWLTTRFISSILTDSAHPIVLASWLRSPSFWKNEIRRTTGLDPSKPQFASRFHPVDCFSTARALPEIEDLISSTISLALSPTHPHPPSNLPSAPASHPTRPILILDCPSLLLLTTTSPTPSPSHSLNTLLLTLRSRPVHATILACPADGPLISASAASTTSTSTSAGRTIPTPLETEAAAFVAAQAHASRLVLSVRELGTGAARDVSGVLRVTRGGGWDGRGYGYGYGSGCEGDGEGEGGELREAEFLYLVQGSGVARVFGRGEGGGRE